MEATNQDLQALRHKDACTVLSRPPNVALLRAFWSLLDGIWSVLKGTGAVLEDPCKKIPFSEGPDTSFSVN